MATVDQTARQLISEIYEEIAELNIRLSKHRGSRVLRITVRDLGRIKQLLREANGKEDAR